MATRLLDDEGLPVSDDWAWARAPAADPRILGAADRVAAGLDAGPDGALPEPWGALAPVDGIDDVRRAWTEPVPG